MENDYFRKAVEFLERGKKEYEDGLKERDTIKIREGCKKVFHALVELSNGILSEHGIQLPENHKDRSKVLDTFGLDTTYDWIKERLHDTCYYGEVIDPKWLKKAIDTVEEEINRWMSR
ncbi:MAG: hypothetical protein ACE5J3_05155 [Methanosarcinales archaeon]